MEYCLMSAAKKPAAKAPDGAASPPEKKGMSMMLVIGLVVGALALGGGGAWWFVSSKAHAEESDSGAKKSEKKKHKKKSSADGPAVYIPLDPGFVVNLADGEGARYLQANLDVMVRDPEMVEVVKLHMPAIRNSLLMLFGQKSVAELQNVKQREGLRKEALKAVQKVLEEETGDPGVEEIFFTAFVTQ
jgi:flagellar FliL protein